MKYDELLDKAFEELPEVVYTKQRFEIKTRLYNKSGPNLSNTF